MQDYNINVNYTQEQYVTKTSPKYQPFESKTKAATETQKEKSERKERLEKLKANCVPCLNAPDFEIMTNEERKEYFKKYYQTVCFKKIEK